MRCHSCGTLTTEPPLKPEDIGPLYTDYYPRHIIDLQSVEARGNRSETLHQRFMYWWYGNHKIQHMLPLQGDSKRVLDIGCGDGASLIELERRGFEAYGIETDENISIVRDALKLNLHIGTIEDCPFPQGTFDYAIANQVIEHIIDLESFIAHTKQFMVKNGTLILSTPNADSIYRRIFGRAWAHWHIPYHQHILTSRAIGILLARHGFEVISKRTVSPTTWMIHTLNRLRFTPQQGMKNPLWAYEQKDAAASQEKPSKNHGFPAKLKSVLKRAVYLLVLNLISLCNRIVDLLQSGDCIVISARLK
ncbi:MAG: class I SAM-dependent methyltransferase [Patescibacteria group bacterium]